MNHLYDMAGISKQGHYKQVAKSKGMEDITQEVIVSANLLRRDHKVLGCRKMYWEIAPRGIGRDKTEAILLSNGFRVKRKRNRTRTTYAGNRSYINRISGMELRDINQLWVSDITYIRVSYNKHYYLTLIQDVYSRRITGWELSSTLQASESVLPAYRRAMASISEQARKGLIFHSDKGSQYIWKELEKLHRLHGVLPSMGGKAWENAHAESINGILKCEYIDFEAMEVSLSKARKVVQDIIHKYNYKRPHGSLKRMKPSEYETYLDQLADQDKPIVTINY